MRPVELTGIINRTQDYAQLKQNEDQKPVTDQVNFQTQFDKKIEKNSEIVVKKRDSEWNNNKFDAKEKGKNQYYANKKNNKEKEEEDGKVTVKPRVSFDVKI